MRKISNRLLITPYPLARKRWSIMCVLYFLLLFLPLLLNAQKVTAVLERDKILLGEQVTLQLKLEDFNPRMSGMDAWFNIPDTGNHIEVIKRENIDTVDVGGTNTYLQKIVITSFDSGQWVLPPLQVTMHDNTSGKQIVLKADILSLEVLPVNVDSLKNYHEIKDIIEVQVKNDPYIIIAVALLTLISAAAIWYFLKRKKMAPAPVKNTVIKGAPVDWAMVQLKTLQQQQPASKEAIKLFYTKLDEITRQYFDAELNIGSLQSTGDEMMIRLKVYLQQEQVRTQFYQLTRLVDAVKFAKYLPEPSQQNEAVSTAIKTIQHIHQQLQEVKKNNAY